MFDYPPFIIYFFCGFLAFVTFIFTVSPVFIGFKKVVTYYEAKDFASFLPDLCNKEKDSQREEEIDIPDNEKIF